MLNQPELSPVPERNEYLLLCDYPATYGDQEILVPGYFSFDGASVPWFGWLSTYTPFHPDVMAAAVVHDWLFLTHQVDREMADRILYDRLILNGAGSTRAKLMHRAVRIGSGKYWELRPEKIEALRLLHVMIKNSPRYAEYCFPEAVLFD